MQRYRALVLVHVAALSVACRSQPEVRGSAEPGDTTAVVYDYRNLQFRATSEVSNTPHGQRIFAVVTVTNPDRRRVLLTTGIGNCVLWFTAVSEENPEVRVRAPDRVCPAMARNTVIPPETTVAPRELRGSTATRDLLPDSLPDGPYRIVPELVLHGPPEWQNAVIHVPMDAGRAYLKRPR